MSLLSRAAIVVAATLLVSCDAESSAEPEPVKYLFVVTGGSFEYEGDTLSFQAVGPETVWFTDRPYHDAGTMSTDELDAFWGVDGTFAAEPPNSVLVHDENQIAVVQLVDMDYEDDTMSFEVKGLHGEIPPSGGKVTLVIDNCCSDGDGPCTSSDAECPENVL